MNDRFHDFHGQMSRIVNANILNTHLRESASDLIKFMSKEKSTLGELVQAIPVYGFGKGAFCTAAIAAGSTLNYQYKAILHDDEQCTGIVLQVVKYSLPIFGFILFYNIVIEATKCCFPSTIVTWIGIFF